MPRIQTSAWARAARIAVVAAGAVPVMTPVAAHAQTAADVAAAIADCVDTVASGGLRPPVAPGSGLQLTSETPFMAQGWTCSISGADPAPFEAAVPAVVPLFRGTEISQTPVGTTGFDHIIFGGCLEGRNVVVSINGFAAAAQHTGFANVAWLSGFDEQCQTDAPQSKASQ